MNSEVKYKLVTNLFLIIAIVLYHLGPITGWFIFGIIGLLMIFIEDQVLIEEEV